MRSGTVFQRRPSAPLTVGTECSSWPTPDANMGTRGGRHPTDERTDTINDAVRKANYPTPRAVRSPSMVGGSGSAQMLERLERDGTISAGDHRAMRTGSRLSPMWIEWLMGFPSGWTNCED